MPEARLKAGTSPLRESFAAAAEPWSREAARRRHGDRERRPDSQNGNDQTD
jgi:hypothetical protein